MNILICCDDEEYVESMTKIMTKYHFSEERIFDVCSSVNDAMSKCRQKKFDLAFIDCLVNGESAMSVGYEIRQANDKCMILFMHYEMDVAFINESFIIGTFQFLIKGEDEMMEKEFLRASRIYAKENYTLTYITTSMETIQLSPYDIQYVETKNSPTKVATKKVTYRGWFKDGMDLVEQHLKTYNFLQIHSHYLVNMEHVMRIRPDEIAMSNGDFLPVAVLKQDKIKGAFRQFMKW